MGAIAQQKLAGDFNATGLIVTVPGSVTPFTKPGQATLVTRTIPSGAMARLRQWSAKVIDVGNSDQIYFAILLNGMPVASGTNRIPGVEFDYQPQLDVNVLLNPGELSIVAYNISGMNQAIEANAVVGPADTKCQAWFSGDLLSERGGL